MPDFLQKLNDVIADPFVCNANGGKLRLQEFDENGVKVGRPVTFLLPGNIVCLQLDKRGKNIFPFFSREIPDLCKIADRLIFHSKDESLWVFIIELKSGGTSGAIKQLKASFVLSEYVVQTVRRIMDFPILKVNYRGLVVSPKTYKQLTSPKHNFTVVPNTSFKYQHISSNRDIRLIDFIA